MGQDNHVTLQDVFSEQQLLSANYQELDTFVKHQVDQDNRWRVSVDAKLQTILDLLGQSLQTVPQPVSPSFGQSFTPSFGQPVSPSFGHSFPPSFGQPGPSSFTHPVPSSFAHPSSLNQAVPSSYAQPVPSTSFGHSVQMAATDNLGSHFGQFYFSDDNSAAENDSQALREEGFHQEGLPELCRD